MGNKKFISCKSDLVWNFISLCVLISAHRIIIEVWWIGCWKYSRTFCLAFWRWWWWWWWWCSCIIRTVEYEHLVCLFERCYTHTSHITSCTNSVSECNCTYAEWKGKLDNLEEWKCLCINSCYHVWVAMAIGSIYFYRKERWRFFLCVCDDH